MTVSLMTDRTDSASIPDPSDHHVFSDDNTMAFLPDDEDYRIRL